MIFSQTYSVRILVVKMPIGLSNDIADGAIKSKRVTDKYFGAKPDWRATTKATICLNCSVSMIPLEC